MAYNYTATFDLGKTMQRLGLEEQGKVSKFVASQVLALSEPYVPFDELGLYDNPGRLIESGHLEGTDVVWRTPYARYLYYHPEFHFQGATMRGAYWVDRMLQNGGTQAIEDSAQKYIRGLSK